jgi:hypothetical protein
VSERAIPARRLWWLAAGFAVWCSALVALYALHAIGCAFAWSPGSLRLALAVVLLAHLIVIGGMWGGIARAGTDPDFGPTDSFLHSAVTWTLIAALVATAITLGPPLLLATCI